MMYRRYQPNPTKRTVRPPSPPPVHPAKSLPPPKTKKPAQNPVLGWIPSSLYNPQTKKVLGMFSAEDLLLAGLIFLLLENEEKQDNTLIYALLYILISDYIDLPF